MVETNLCVVQHLYHFFFTKHLSHLCTIELTTKHVHVFSFFLVIGQGHWKHLQFCVELHGRWERANKKVK